MIELVTANKVLNHIVNEGMNFQCAINESFSKENRYSDLKNFVSSLVGCELRHHMLFEAFTNKVFEELDSENKLHVCLFLADKFFFKKLDAEKASEFLKEKLGASYDKLIDDKYSEISSVVASLEIEQNSIDYLSIRFNTPKWLIKMWSKYYGRSNCFKILKKNTKPYEPFLVVNDLHKKSGNLDSISEKCQKTELDGLYLLNKNESFKNSFLVRKNILIPMKAPVQYLIDKYYDELSQEFSLYNGSDDIVFRKLFIKSCMKTGINVVVPSFENSVSILREIRLSQAKNINVFEGNDEIGFATGISRKQNVFYVYPESSSFDKIRKYPDYILSFKHDSLDALIEKQKTVLNAAANFVADDGLLIYMVDTLCKKESNYQIEQFLTAHKDYELVEEKQYFPFDNEDMAFYFAVLKKKGEINED